MVMPDSILRVENLRVTFPAPGRSAGSKERLRAVDGVSFEVEPATTLAIVGESGCGKSTTARSILRLYDPDSGRIEWRGQDLSGLKGAALRRFRRDVQMVFQDPYSSLNPRMTIGRLLAEPLEIHRLVRGEAKRARVRGLLELVGLNPAMDNRYPRELSGGERQRVAIARALAVEPKLVVCDEPVSALDASVQGQVVNLLLDLQERLGLTYVFVSHDLGLVHLIADDVVVMYGGVVVEHGPIEEVYREPRHPYTQALLSAVPVADPTGTPGRERILVKGEPPNQIGGARGCVFYGRCRFAFDRCESVAPALHRVRPRSQVACHLFEEQTGAAAARPVAEVPSDS